jgi:putative endopeptidase
MNTPRPQDDFFNYVNSTWIEENPIPPQESKWGSFYVLRVEVEKQLKEIFDKLVAADIATLDENAKKVRNFYETGMDIEKLNAQKDAPLKELFEMVDGITDGDRLVEVLGHLHRNGISALWGSSVDQDAKQSDVMALYLGQSGLSLPDRDYYVIDNEKNLEIRKKYLDYAEDMLISSQELSANKSLSKRGLPKPP